MLVNWDARPVVYDLLYVVRSIPQSRGSQSFAVYDLKFEDQGNASLRYDSPRHLHLRLRQSSIQEG